MANSLLDGIDRVALDAIQLHPQNPRRGDVRLIAESLRANAQYEPLVVQRATGYVLAGNHRLMAARELGWDEIDVVYVDVDEEHALRIMLSSNRTADVGDYDLELLVGHLKALRELDALEGTGYTDDDLDERLAEIRRRLDETPKPTPAPNAPPDVQEVVLLYGPDGHAGFARMVDRIAKEKGTDGVSETVYAALEIAVDALDG